jgi:hypothetical protein
MALAWGDRTGAARVDLVARIDAMAARAERLRPGELAHELEAIRRIAARHGIGPAMAAVHALDIALSRGERGPLVHGWLAILRDAVGCTVSTQAASDTYAAACAVRLNG